MPTVLTDQQFALLAGSVQSPRLVSPCAPPSKQCLARWDRCTGFSIRSRPDRNPASVGRRTREPRASGLKTATSLDCSEGLVKTLLEQSFLRSGLQARRLPKGRLAGATDATRPSPGTPTARPPRVKLWHNLPFFVQDRAQPMTGQPHENPGSASTRESDQEQQTPSSEP